MSPKLRPWSVALWLLAWQGGSMALAAAYPHGALLLASPIQAALRLLELLPSPAFWRAAGNSSARIFGGFLLSCALAGFLMGKGLQKRRFFCGFMAGLSYFLILLGVSFFLNKGVSSDTSQLLTTLAFCVGSGIIGGVSS